jgi:hypothetical protein
MHTRHPFTRTKTPVGKKDMAKVGDCHWISVKRPQNMIKDMFQPHYKESASKSKKRAFLGVIQDVYRHTGNVGKSLVLFIRDGQLSFTVNNL